MLLTMNLWKYLLLKRKLEEFYNDFNDIQQTANQFFQIPKEGKFIFICLSVIELFNLVQAIRNQEAKGIRIIILQTMEFKMKVFVNFFLIKIN